MLFLVISKVACTVYMYSDTVYMYVHIKGNVAVYKDLNIEFVTKKSFCHKNTV